MIAGGPPLAWVAFPVVGDAGARWPALGGRGLHLGVCTAAPEALPASRTLLVGPEREYVFWALPDQRVLVLARDRLLAVLSAIAPGQLRERPLTLPRGPASATALADPSRLLGYASGEELLGLRYRRLLEVGEGTVAAAPDLAPEVGTGLVLVAEPVDRAPAAAEVLRRLRELGALLSVAAAPAP